VLRVSSRTGDGLAELWEAIRACPLRRGARGEARELLRLAQQTLAARFAGAEGEARVQELLGRWRKGEVASPAAAAELLRLLPAADGRRWVIRRCRCTS